MKKFYSTYTTTFFLLSILLTFFFLLEADFLAIPITGHPLVVAWSRYTGLAYLPLLIIFLFPSLVVLLSYGVGSLTGRKDKTLSLSLKTLYIDLTIIIGSISFGIVINYIFSRYLPEESLPLLYSIFICIASFMLGILIIGWKNNHSYFKERRIKNPGFRDNQRFSYTLFNLSLTFAIIWLILGIMSTPIPIEYDVLVAVCLVLYFFYSVIVWSLSLAIYLRDRFINRIIPRILFTCITSLPAVTTILLTGAFIHISIEDIPSLSGYYNRSIEEYKTEKEEKERLEREAREAEYLAYRTEYLARMEAARASVTLVDEDYKPVIREFSFDFLWNNPETEVDSVTSAISFALTQHPDHLMDQLMCSNETEEYDPEKYVTYYRKKGEGSFELLRRYLTWKFPVENMTGIVFRYIDYLPTLLPEEDFRDSDFEETLITYMVAYQELYHSQDNFGAFHLVYDIVSTPLEAEETYSIYKINALYYDRFIPYLDVKEECDPEDIFEKNDLARKYSFWARRYNEGTHRDLYYIMKKIWKLYN